MLPARRWVLANARAECRRRWPARVAALRPRGRRRARRAIEPRNRSRRRAEGPGRCHPSRFAREPRPRACRARAGRTSPRNPGAGPALRPVMTSRTPSAWRVAVEGGAGLAHRDQSCRGFRPSPVRRARRHAVRHGNIETDRTMLLDADHPAHAPAHVARQADGAGDAGLGGEAREEDHGAAIDVRHVGAGVLGLGVGPLRGARGSRRPAGATRARWRGRSCPG